MPRITLGPRVAQEQRIAAQERNAIQRMLEQTFPYPASWWHPHLLRAIANLLHALTIEDGRRAALERALEDAEAERDAAMDRVADMLNVMRAIEYPETLFN